MASVSDVPILPGEFFAKFQASFYADPHRRRFQGSRGGMKTTISEKGQVTIPKPLRDRLALFPWQVLDFREEKGRLVPRRFRWQIKWKPCFAFYIPSKLPTKP